MSIYLCGGINGLSDGDCKDWREEAKRLLAPLECLDPMRRDYRGREAGLANEIVKNDLDDIRQCTCVLVNASRPSRGTAMEIRIAAEMGRPVVAFGAGDRPSPWLVYHAELQPSLHLAVERVLEIAKCS